jgi:broad specificity phosphatase PhoE
MRLMQKAWHRPLLVAVLAALAAADAPAAGQEMNPLTTVIVVRHAEKVDSSTDPLLSEAGRQRAAALADALAHAGVTAIFTTQYRRNQATAEPLASRAGLRPKMVQAARDAAAHAAAVAALARQEPAGSVVLVIGHSNTVPAIIAALGGPEVPAIDDDAYSDFFVLQLAGDRTRLIHARY